jgi:hypothetical protein
VTYVKHTSKVIPVSKYPAVMDEELKLYAFLTFREERGQL